jgi:hypothetical protein
MFDDLDDEERVNLACGALGAVEQLTVLALPGSTLDCEDLAPLLNLIGRACRAAMPKIGNNHRVPHAHND